MKSVLFLGGPPNVVGHVMAFVGYSFYSALAFVPYDWVTCISAGATFLRGQNANENTTSLNKKSQPCYILFPSKFICSQSRSAVNSSTSRTLCLYTVMPACSTLVAHQWHIWSLITTHGSDTGPRNMELGRFLVISIFTFQAVSCWVAAPG